MLALDVVSPLQARPMSTKTHGLPPIDAICRHLLASRKFTSHRSCLRHTSIPNAPRTLYECRVAGPPIAWRAVGLKPKSSGNRIPGDKAKK
jgi:hypothetical protein